MTIAAPASNLPERVTMPFEPESELVAEEVATMLSEMTAAAALATATATASSTGTASL